MTDGLRLQFMSQCFMLESHVKARCHVSGMDLKPARTSAL